jgi:hypothetical protein
MGRGAQLMIHNSRTIAIGTADDMRAVAESLDMVDSDIASFYAERAQVTGVGTSAETFRDAMRAETWYTAAAAVAIGLADEQGEDAGDEPAEDEPAGDEPAEDEPAGDEPAEDEPAEDEPAEDGEDDEPESLAGMAAAMAPDRWIAAMQAWAPAPPRRRARPSRAAAAAPRPPRAAPAGRQPAPPVAFPLTPSTFRAAIRRAHP